MDLASSHDSSDPGDSFTNIVHQLVWTLSQCRPQPVLRPEVLVYVCKMYGAWSPAMTMLQDHALSITDELTPIRVQVRHSVGRLRLFLPPPPSLPFQAVPPIRRR